MDKVMELLKQRGVLTDSAVSGEGKTQSYIVAQSLEPGYTEQCMVAMNDAWHHLRRLRTNDWGPATELIRDITATGKPVYHMHFKPDVKRDLIWLAEWKQDSLHKAKPELSRDAALQYLPLLVNYLESGQAMADYRSAEFRDAAFDRMALQLNPNDIVKISERRQTKLQKRCLYLHKLSHNLQHGAG